MPDKCVFHSELCAYHNGKFNSVALVKRLEPAPKETFSVCQDQEWGFQPEAAEIGPKAQTEKDLLHQ